MINVDISNVWGQVTLPNLLDLEKEVAAAHAAVADGAGHEIPGWMRLPLESEQPELERLLAAAVMVLPFRSTYTLTCLPSRAVAPFTWSRPITAVLVLKSVP